MTEFGERLLRLQEKYEAACGRVRSDLRVHLDLLLATVAELEQGAPRVEEAIIEFIDWIATASIGDVFHVRDFSGNRLAYVTAHSYFRGLSSYGGSQAPAEIAYQIRWKLASRDRQLHPAHPNVRIVVEDLFHDLAADKRTVGMAALGYFHKGQWTEGVLGLSGNEPLLKSSNLPAREVSRRLKAVAYWQPLLSSSGSGRVFAMESRANANGAHLTVFAQPGGLPQDLQSIAAKEGWTVITDPEVL